MVERVKKLLHGEQGLQGAATLLVVTMFLSNALGFLRDVVLANTLPLGVLDTYYAAFRIPDFLFNLFILGAISSAFIPVFLDLKTRDGKEESWRLAHNLMHTALVVLLVLGVVLYAFMPQLLPYFVPGFSPEKIAATVPLARILLLSPFFFAISYILGGILNAYHKFFAYSLAPLVYNAAIICGGFLAVHVGVTGIAWAVVVGAFLHMLVQLPVLRGLGYRYQFVLDWRDKELRRVVALMVPRAISLGMTQIVLVAFTRLASLFASGAVSIYTLTNNLQTAPVAILGASIATAVFPLLSEATSEKDDTRFKHLLTESLRGMLFYMLPITALAWVLRAHIIRLYLALDHQTWDDTIRAIQTFQWFILALVAQTAILILIRAYYARQDTQRPMIISLITGVVTVGLASLLSGTISEVSALSLAFFIGVSTEVVILLAVFASAHKGLIDFRLVLQTALVSGIFSVAAGLFARFLLSVVSEGLILPVGGLGTEHILPLFYALVAGAVGGLAVYIGLALVCQRSEMQWLRPKRAARSSVLLAESEEVASNEGLS